MLSEKRKNAFTAAKSITYKSSYHAVAAMLGLYRYPTGNPSFHSATALILCIPSCEQVEPRDLCLQSSPLFPCSPLTPQGVAAAAFMAHQSFVLQQLTVVI